MKCVGSFVFKSVNKREGGEFKNPNGELIPYDDAYVIRADEETETGIQERKLKFPCTNTSLFNSLKELGAYTRIHLEFHVDLYNNQAKLTPIKLLEE